LIYLDYINRRKIMEYLIGNYSYMKQFDCFVKVVDKIVLLDGTVGYRVENKQEGIVDMLVRPTELYGIVKGE